MATLDELQAQLTALTQRVNAITAPPDDYYTHRFSGEEMDNAVDRVKATPGSGAITAGDIGAAPSGFGLGTGFANAPGVDANQIVANGIYAANQNVPISGVTFIVEAKVGATAANQIQYAYAYRPSSGAPTASTVQRRVCDNGTWGVWEWVNPPMVLGVEYRTTERYNQKPVYTKLVDCGAGPNKTRKTVSGVAQNVETPVSAFGTWGAITIPYEWYSGDSSGAQAINCTMQEASIQIAGTADYSANTVYVKIKYTKTTD